MNARRAYHWRHDPTRSPRHRRPRPACSRPVSIPDEQVLQLTALVDASGALEQIDARIGQRPGPAGLPARTILVGLLLALYHRGKANLDDVSELLHLSLSARMRALLGVQAIDGNDSCSTRAAYARCTRAFDAITTAFDPQRHDRRRRLSRERCEAVAAAWEDPANAETVHALETLANTLIQSTVTVAVNRRLLRHWPGDIGIDATPAPAWGQPPSRRRGPLDIGAGWYRKGGKKEFEWAYSLTLAITGHGDPAAADRYPQLCLSMQMHRPSRQTGPAAIKALLSLEHFAFRKGYLAVDRAYPQCEPTDFQMPARELGYKLLLDYDVTAHRSQGSTLGATWRGGQLYCPALPNRLRDAGMLLRKRATADEIERGKRLVQEADVYRMHLKESTRPDGTYRVACPAASPSPTVTCPRAEARGDKRRPAPRTVDLNNRRARLSHPVTLLRVQPKDEPDSAWPTCCTQASITVLPTDNAKYAQALAHGTSAWLTSYKSIRAQNEGANGWLKGIDTCIATAKHRLARGRVAQTLLLALTIAITNLRRLEQFLRDRYEDPAALLDHLLPEDHDASSNHDAEITRDTPGTAPPTS